MDARAHSPARTLRVLAAPLCALSLIASPAARAHAPTDVDTIVHRVNAGGPTLAGTPPWSSDTQLNPSPYGNGNSLGNPPFSVVTPINLTHPSVPAGTPQALFQSQRWDSLPAAPNLRYDFPVEPGRYDVHLYFAEIIGSTMSPGARQMDVWIEGALVLDNYDQFSDAGAGNRGVVRQFDVVSDATLTIEFGHVVQHPAIKAIEIIQVAQSQQAGLVATPSPLAYGSVLTGQSKSLPLQLTHNGAAGTSPITVESTAIAGTNAGDFSDSFDDAGSITLGPGQSTTIDVGFAPGGTGARAATLNVTHSGSTAPVAVPLEGTGTAPPAAVAFGKSKLAGKAGFGPTVLEWGSDGRLYVGYFDGTIRAYTIARSGPNAYAVTATETITAIKSIPNHDDNGVPNPAVTTRLLTGLTVAGTAASPVLYVASSDPRIGGGPQLGDLNLDTNGSTVSRLTKSGSDWSRLELVRGLPRSEENHAANGLALDIATNTLFLAQGGNTNRGAPSLGFAFLPEYAYSAAVLSIDLDAIGATTYDLPTLDDDTRPGTPDAGDPFGGNDGRNQARLTPSSPVQVHSPGYRNPYDVALTQSGRLFTIDNGGNAGWGNVPVGEGPAGTCTNATSDPGVTDADALHHIAAAGYYGGHPNPTRANLANTFNTLPAQAAVTTANPVECDHRKSGTAESTAWTTFPGSTNGLDEYTASNFGGAMKGDLVTALYNENAIYRIDLDAGQTALLARGPIASALGVHPLGIDAVGDGGPFPGTVWATDETTGDIHVLEPSDYDSGGPPPCSGADSPTLDEDDDGYDNADEIDAGTSPCSSADTPPDHDDDQTSDVTDADDDNDTLADTSDPFAIDAQNGTTRALPVEYLWENDGSPAGGLLGLGFTGLMTNGSADYRTLYDVDTLTAGGAAGVLTLDEVSEGDATGAANTQAQAFQFGVDADSAPGPFTAHTRIVGPFSGITPSGSQSMGLQIGTGGQDDFVKVVATRNGAEVVREIGGTVKKVGSATFARPAAVDLYLGVDRAAHTVQASYSLPGEQTIAIGPATAIPAAWTSSATRGLAVGIISTSAGPPPAFPATWDFVTVTVDAPSGGDAPVAADSFTRKVNDGWGQADTGGAWTIAGGAGPFAVNGTAGTIATRGGAVQRMATLDATSIRDVDATAEFALAATPTAGGSVLGDLLLRAQGGGAHYRVGLQFTSAGAVLVRGQTEAGTPLWSDASTGLSFAPGERVSLRVQAHGAAPTTLRARAWKTGTAEPSAWQVVATDAAAGPQTAGALGLRTLNTTSTSVQVRVDALVARAASSPTEPPPAGTWNMRTAAGSTRQEVAYVKLGSKLYLAGGTAQHEVYDPVAGTWRFIRPLPVRMDHIQGVAVGSKLYYVGGLTSWPGPSVDTVWIYDPSTDTFSEGARMPAGRGRGAGGVAVRNGRIYYAGGLASGNVVPWFDVYDPVANTWTALPDMPRARDHFHGAVLGGRFHAIGGRALAINSTITAHDAFDFATGRWQTGLAPLPTARGGFAAAVLDDRIFVIGGEGGGRTYADVEAYSPATDSWRAYAPMPTARHGIQAAVCGKGLWLAAGGLTQGGANPSNAHEVFYPGTPGACGG